MFFFSLAIIFVFVSLMSETLHKSSCNDATYCLAYAYDPYTPAAATMLYRLSLYQLSGAWNEALGCLYNNLPHCNNSARFKGTAVTRRVVYAVRKN